MNWELAYRELLNLCIIGLIFFEVWIHWQTILLTAEAISTSEVFKISAYWNSTFLHDIFWNSATFMVLKSLLFFCFDILNLELFEFQRLQVMEKLYGNGNLK